MALPKIYRLKRTKDFERIFKEGKTVKSSFFFIKFLKNTAGHSCIAVVVPSRVSKKSHQRHRFQRIVYTGLYNKKYFSMPFDMVVVISFLILGKSSEEIKTELQKAIHAIANSSI